MIKLTTLCTNIATALAILFSVSATIAQQPVSILQQDFSDQPLTFPAVAEEPISDDLSILTRGPLHEAFASAHQPDPHAAALIRKRPPKLIDELPPEYKPVGNNVQWVPGYWAWDDSQSDFIWISGIWRDVPPNRRWMPGYWDVQGNAYRWVSGFWIEETRQELAYLPQPPASIDQGPSTVSPNAQHFYVPGNWQFQNNGYRWTAGNWQPVIENRIWVPSQYVWTPNGCVFQSGYWDYELENRGTCFAPVHFNRPVYLANRYSYRPSYAINLNTDFMTHLFVRPNSGHYFYGDWYASNFNNLGYRPWVSYTSHFRNYDPLLTYYSSRRSSFDRRYNVVQYLALQHNFYNKNRDYRPRPTYRAQYNHARSMEQRGRNRGNGKDYILGSSYVGAYKHLRMHGDKHGRPTTVTGYRPAQHKHDHKKHRKVAEQELRNQRRKQQLLAELQRDRKHREHSGHNRVTTNSGGKNQPRDVTSSRVRQQDLDRQAQQRNRLAEADDLRRNQTRQRGNTPVKLQSRAQLEALLAQSSRIQHENAKRTRQERERRTQQERERRTQQEKARRAQQEIARQNVARNKAQQNSARIAQQNQARREQQENSRRAQQQNSRRNVTGNTSGKMRMQNIPSIKEREAAARKVQQEQARRAQLDRARQQSDQRARQQQAQRDSARKAQQKAQQDRARQQSAQRARQQQAQRDSARKAQQKAQQDRARQQSAQRARQQQAQRDSARKAQQKAQQDRARQQSAQRARQQQAQRDSARKAQQKAQQDAARRAKKSSQAKAKKPSQESRSSRLRNRSVRSKKR